MSTSYRPDQSRQEQEASWQFLRHEDSALSHVHTDTGGDRRIRRDNSLVIQSVDVMDAGRWAYMWAYRWADRQVGS